MIQLTYSCPREDYDVLGCFEQGGDIVYCIVLRKFDAFREFSRDAQAKKRVVRALQMFSIFRVCGKIFNSHLASLQIAAVKKCRKLYITSLQKLSQPLSSP